ncbi:HtaA domain-containing protein [Streptomyces sp. NPDC006365]|uniref:HtaA domain-containing protein n=1 Tax=Streptomyces sp. NPDC006365 TaxID=3364744 RepID=UPI0036B50D29
MTTGSFFACSKVAVMSRATTLLPRPSVKTISNYELTWGIKESYRNYVTGMALGSFTPADGAKQAAGNGAFTFVEGTGTYDSEAHTVDLGFKGSLKIESKAHGFELTLSDVKFDSKGAEITADVTKGGATTQDVPLADVTVTRDMKDMATKLTKEAADAFGSASYQGAAGDPLTVVDKGTTPPTEDPTTPPTDPTTPPTTPPSDPHTQTPPTAGNPTSPSTTQPADSPPSAAPTKGDIADGTLGWGVKQSFRTYVVDGVAKGEITVSGGATQASGNGAFTFVDGSGTYDTEADTLSAAFKGSVNFKGHEENGTYGLDLTLSDLKAKIDGDSGTLTADVNSLGDKSDDVVVADLRPRSADLVAEDDVITLPDVTAKLTAAGADAFGGFYQAGAELDPVDLSVALSADAELPPNDDPSASATPTSDSGSGTTGGTGAGSTGSTTGGGVTGGGLAATGSSVPAGALGAVAAVTVAAGAGVVFAVRRRRAGEQG